MIPVWLIFNGIAKSQQQKLISSSGGDEISNPNVDVQLQPGLPRSVDIELSNIPSSVSNLDFKLNKQMEASGSKPAESLKRSHSKGRSKTRPIKTEVGADEVEVKSQHHTESSQNQNDVANLSSAISDSKSKKVLERLERENMKLKIRVLKYENKDLMEKLRVHGVKVNQ